MDLTRIKVRAEQQSITLKKICSTIDMSYQNLNRCIKENKISANDLESIAKVLKVPVSYFFDEKNSNGNYVGKIENGDVLQANKGNINYGTDCKQLKERIEELKSTNSFIKKLLEAKEKENKGLERDIEFYHVQIMSLFKDVSILYADLVRENKGLLEFLKKHGITQAFLNRINTYEVFSESTVELNKEFVKLFK